MREQEYERQERDYAARRLKRLKAKVEEWKQDNARQGRRNNAFLSEKVAMAELDRQRRRDLELLNVVRNCGFVNSETKSLLEVLSRRIHKQTYDLDDAMTDAIMSQDAEAFPSPMTSGDVTINLASSESSPSFSMDHSGRPLDVDVLETKLRVLASRDDKRTEAKDDEPKHESPDGGIEEGANESASPKKKKKKKEKKHDGEKRKKTDDSECEELKTEPQKEGNTEEEEAKDNEKGKEEQPLVDPTNEKKRKNKKKKKEKDAPPEADAEKKADEEEKSEVEASKTSKDPDSKKRKHKGTSKTPPKKEDASTENVPVEESSANPEAKDDTSKSEKNQDDGQKKKKKKKKKRNPDEGSG